MTRQTKNTIEKTLSIFTECRAGEGYLALLMTLNIFLILTSYLIAKVLREPLILTGGGAELKSYASAIQVVLLVGALRFYGWLVAKLPRRKLINAVTLFFMACMAAFYAYFRFVGPGSGIVYFLWVGIFSLVIIAQFWSYANDIYTTEQGKRLFILLAFGASAGGVFGPMLANRLIDLVGLYQMLLASIGILFLGLILTNYIDKRLVKNNKPEKAKKQEVDKISRKGALKVVFQSKYLLMIAFLILLTNWVNTTGEYILGKGVENSADMLLAADPLFNSGEYIGKFYSRFFSIVGFAGLLLQLFVVSRIIKYLGVRVALLILPFIAVGGYIIIAVFPILRLIQYAKTAENATDYSLNNTVRHVLFLPTTKEEKYKAKVAIDSFFVRAGDVLSAAVVFAGVTWFAFEIYQFALFNLTLCIVWIVLALLIGREYKLLTRSK
jgi:AAA family ATP:ADP antiporter